MVKIALDVMSAEVGYEVPIKAAYKFCKINRDVVFYFTGIAKKLEVFVNKLKFPKDQFVIVDASDIIKPSDSIIAIRRKPNSSMMKAIQLVNDDQCDIVISSGATGVFLAACHLILKEMEGIERPAIMPLIPNCANGANILLDVGATIEPKVKDLWKYAHMAKVYAKEILAIEDPIVGLVNIGEESSKGLTLQKEVHQKLKDDSSINFYGNIEPREIFSTKCNIYLMDGWSGNLVLKTLEGTAQNISTLIREEFKRNIFTKIRSLFVYSILKSIRNRFNYKKYNGALIIGLNKPAFKTHGSSDEYSYFSVIKMAYSNIKNDVVNKIKKEISNETN